MIAIENVQRYRSIHESLIGACKEVKLMREGKMGKPTLQSLWDNIERYKIEADNKYECTKFTNR